jgi:HPt (histidine-containing phosphotransfer) domain-containing protein
MLKCWLNKSSSFSAVSQNPFSIVQLSSLLRRYLSEPASAAPQAALPQTELVTPVLHPTSAESSTSSAHALKSMSLNVWAQKVARLAGAIELACRRAAAPMTRSGERWSWAPVSRLRRWRPISRPFLKP